MLCSLICFPSGWDRNGQEKGREIEREKERERKRERERCFSLGHMASEV